MGGSKAVKIVIFVAFVACTAITFAAATEYVSTATLHLNCLKLGPTSTLSIEYGMAMFGGVKFYLPFGSSKAIKHLSQLVLAGGAGKNNKQQAVSLGKGSSETKFCAQVRIRGFKLQIDGHGDHFLTQDCAVITKGQNKCVVNPNSQNPEGQSFGDGIITIVWTDNESTIAIVDCADDGVYNDWYVLSSHPVLNETVKSTVLEEMRKLGFADTMEDTTTQSYEGCEMFSAEED